MSESWVAVEACTLPTAERPLRLAEFDALFAERLESVEPAGDSRVVLLFRDGPDAVEAIADLTARETECCSFFEFSLARVESGLRLDVTVPPAHSEVLAALVTRAQSQRSGTER